MGRNPEIWIRLFGDWNATNMPAQIIVVGTQLLVLIGSVRKWNKW